MKYIKLLSITIVTFFMALLIARPDVYMASVLDGLKLFAISVLPASFPFFFFSKILTSLDVAKSMSGLTKKTTRFLFNSPDIGGYIFVMSMLCGYPVGARLVADSFTNKIITENEAKSLIAFTSTSGPLFVLGTVGAGMLQNYTAGIIIILTHYLSAIINGIIFKNKIKSQNNLPPALAPSNYDDILSDALNSSIASVMIVGGYIAIFNMAITALNDIGIIAGLGTLLLKIGIPNRLTEGFFSGLIEITRGSLLLSVSGYSFNLIVPLIAALVSFGGLSITLQSLTFLSKCKIKPWYYLLTKASQAVINFILCFIICSIVY